MSILHPPDVGEERGHVPVEDGDHVRDEDAGGHEEHHPQGEPPPPQATTHLGAGDNALEKYNPKQCTFENQWLQNVLVCDV